MGCTASAPATPTPAETGVSRAAAQSFFNLDGLPLSVTVVPVDKRSLQLRVVGLDCVEELYLLEAAFAKRELSLKSATLLRIGQHVDQTFEVISKATPKNTPMKAFMSPQRPKPNDVKLEKVTPEAAIEEVPSAEAAVKGVQANEILKLSINCTFKGGERGLIAETMHKLKHRLVCATLKTELFMEAQDTYWMVPDSDEGDPGSARKKEDLLSEFRFALFDQVQKINSIVAGKKRKSFVSPLRPSHNSPDRGEDPGRKGSVALADEINARTPVNGDMVLPLQLRSLQCELEYILHGPTNVGLIVDGFQKYVGIGLVQRSTRKMLGYKDPGEEVPLQLEMRTLFVSKQKAEAAGKTGPISHLTHMVQNTMGLTAQYSNFVSWLDITAKTWTIDRVYLNNVLPNGKGLGAKAMAEHLLAPPELFFPKGESSDRAPQWMGSFMESAPDLEKLVVSDIVNWNTYMLMAVRGTPDAKSAEALVGDVLDIALQTELSHAKLTKETLQSLSVLEVFQRTVLGKLCLSVLKQWNAKLKRDIRMESAEVVLGEGDERIFGQRRPRMAVILKLSASRDSAERAKTRLKSATHNLAKAEDHIHITAADDWSKEEGVKEVKEDSEAEKKMASTDSKTSDPSSWGGFGRSPSQLSLGSMTSIPQFEAERPKNNGMMESLSEDPSQSRDSKANKASLAGMGKILELSFAAGPPTVNPFKKADGSESPGTGTEPETFTSACVYFTGVSSAMTCLLHELQCERGLSCRCTAAAALEGKRECDIAKERLRLQRVNTDKAVFQLLDLLKIAASLVEKGTIERRHTAVLDLQQQISISTMVQRGLVDDAISEGIQDWMERYLTVCTCGETGYHVIIGKLLRGIVKALAFASEGITDDEMKAVTARRCALLLRCKEQVGQERGMLAAKGSSRWVETDKGREMFNATRKGSERLQQIILRDEMTWSNPMNKLVVVDALREMHLSYNREAQGPSFSIPAEKAIGWFECLTQWIDAAYDQIQEEITLLGEQIPDTNVVAQPAPAVSLRFAPAPGEEAPDVGAEDVQLLISDLKAGKFSRVVVMAGAGISVSANLPDFRSPGGLYDQLRKTTNISAPETIFTGSFLKSNPELFFEVVQKLRTDHVNPTLTHCFIKLLEERRLLKRCYTQNIDCLERKAGIPEDLLVECHGTTASVRCHDCGKQYSKDVFFDWDGKTEKRNATKAPTCSACGGLLRPNIVLFGEALAGGFQEKSSDDLKECDLLIIMGTSLQVQPFASLPKLVKAGCAVLVINREMPSSLKLHRQVRSFKSKLSGTKLRKEVFLQGDCDTSIRWLATELGWSSELEGLFMQSR